MPNNSTNLSDSDNNNLVTIFETKKFWSFITFCYCVVFLVGIVGNLWSICSIIGSFMQNHGEGVCFRFLLPKSERIKIFNDVAYKKPPSKNSLAKKSNQNLMSKNLLLYNLALNLSDLCVLSNVFLLLTESYLERWPFGVGLCKFYWTLENANKIVSKFILTAMSLDRFVSMFWMKKPQSLTSLTVSSCSHVT
uniref:G-protein coupled receptors family 1 profile domain-containing protein n=1 Tax=Romanomermis culicivorax TaxID=13658 RepID=A0A915JFP5_ROMCU